MSLKLLYRLWFIEKLHFNAVNAVNFGEPIEKHDTFMLECVYTHYMLMEVRQTQELLSCAFNMDSGCVELKFSDSSMIAINCTTVENEIADNMYQRSELDYLIYNDPLAYADLVLNGDPEAYLKSVTEYKPLD